ncbi:MAG: ATP-binding cassette domain-containing protein, partial [Clostridia bacterium]|nr:ATP-binding cassette domain-containing protein [Clostridia bacterium]
MIEFRDVTVVYDKDIVGLDRVSFKINDGEFVFLVGKTGAGKSSAIKLLTGEIRPTSGDVIVDGIVVNSLRRSKIPYLRRAQGVVFQD